MWQMEMTDTFGGKANYCWVRRAPLPQCKQTQRGIVRAAKGWAGWQGIPCTVESYGDMYRINPRGMCQVLFVTAEY